MSDEVSHDNTPAIHRARELCIRQQHIQLFFITYVETLLIDDPLSGSKPSLLLLDDIVALITYQVNRYLNLYKDHPSLQLRCYLGYRYQDRFSADHDPAVASQLAMQVSPSLGCLICLDHRFPQFS